MRIQDYKNADCKLFRTPNLDFSKIDKGIEKKIIEAWQKGNSAQDIIRNIIEGELKAGLLGQASESLEMQQKVYLDSLDERKRKILEKYKQQKEEKLKQITSFYETEEKKTETELVQAKTDVEKKGTEYSVTQKNLEDMRLRVNDTLKKLGGKEKLKELDEIETMIFEKLPEKSAGVYQSPESPGTGKIEKPQKQDRQLMGTIDDVLQTAEDENEGTGKKFMKKVWKVLNYKIW